MTNDNDNTQEKSPEEFALQTLGLESYLNASGQNHIRGNRGKFGELVSNSAEKLDILGSEEAQKIKKELEGNEKEYRDKLGYNGQYSGINNEQIGFKMYEITRESLSKVKLGNLEKFLKDKGAKINTKISEEFKSTSQNEILEKIKNGANPEDYRDFMQTYQALTEIYDTVGAKKIIEKVDFYEEPNKILEYLEAKHSKEKSD